MPAKEPFHAPKKTSKSSNKSGKNTDKTKHEILLSSKNLDETKGKLKRAASQETPVSTSGAKEFIVESGIESQKLRVDLDTSKASTIRSKIGAEGMLRASRLYGDNFVDNSFNNSETALVLSEKSTFSQSTLAKRKKYIVVATNFIGLLLTVAWGGIVAGYVSEYIGWEEMTSLQPHIMGGFLAGILAPIAFLWFILHLFQRGSEIGKYTEGLRIEMQNMLFPSDEARQVLQKDMQALCEQAAELSTFSKTMLGSIHNARVGLKDDVAALERMSNQSQRNFDDLTQNLAQRSIKLLALTEEIELRTNNIEQKSLNGAEAWDETTLKILERASDIEASMQKSSDKIASATKLADVETKTAHDAISQTVKSIDEQANVIEGRLGNLNLSINENQKELTLSADLFASDTKRLADLLEGQMISLQDLEGVSQKSMGIMQQAMEQNAKQQEVLSEELQDRVIELSTISEMAQEKTASVGEALKTQTKAIEQELNTAQNALSNKIDTATQNLKSQEYAISQVIDDAALKVSAGIDNAAKALISTQDDISLRLEGRSDEFIKSVEVAKDDVRRAEEALFERHENIHQDFKKTYSRLSASVVDAKSMMGSMDQGIQQEQERLSSTVDKFKADQSLLESLLREHTQSIDSVESVADKTLELTRELLREDTKNQEQFITNLESKLASLKDASSTINEQSEESNAAISKLGTAQDLLVKQSEILTKVTEQAEEDLGQLESALYEKQLQTRKQADSILSDLSTIDQSFDTRLPALLSQSLDVKDSLKAVSSEIEKSSILLDQKLKSQASKIEHLSRNSVDQMSDSIGTLAETLVQIGGMVEGVQDSIDQSSAKFTDKAAQLSSISKDASIAVEQASSIFAKRSESMHKTAVITSENVKKLQETQQQMRQEVFMGAAKFVLESLNSLAVDLTRSIDGGIHERMWKAYKNGDIGIFTSYLVSVEDELPMDEYQQKFMKDHDFRNYIKSFIGQYEEMISQATKVDNGALLATTFSTSDIGKLYRLLCVIADTAPLTQMKEISAG